MLTTKQKTLARPRRKNRVMNCGPDFQRQERLKSQWQSWHMFLLWPFVTNNRDQTPRSSGPAVFMCRFSRGGTTTHTRKQTNTARRSQKIKCLPTFCEMKALWSVSLVFLGLQCRINTPERYGPNKIWIHSSVQRTPHTFRMDYFGKEIDTGFVDECGCTRTCSNETWSTAFCVAHSRGCVQTLISLVQLHAVLNWVFPVGLHCKFPVGRSNADIYIFFSPHSFNPMILHKMPGVMFERVAFGIMSCHCHGCVPTLRNSLSPEVSTWLEIQKLISPFHEKGLAVDRNQ